VACCARTDTPYRAVAQMHLPRASHQKVEPGCGGYPEHQRHEVAVQKETGHDPGRQECEPKDHGHQPTIEREREQVPCLQIACVPNAGQSDRGW